MPFQQILDLSTVHIKPSDGKLLERYPADERPSGAALIAYPYEYGWTVSTSGLNETDARDGFVEGIRREGFSEAFVELVKFAHDNDCTLVRLDRDGDFHPGLPAFDWDTGEEMENEANSAPSP